MRTLLPVLSLVLALAGASCRQPAPTPYRSSGSGMTQRPMLPGKQPDGSVLLPNQWSLRPVGRQVELGDFPINVAVHPGGRYVAVLHSGYSTHQIMVVDVPAGTVTSRTNLHEAFYGLEFS